MHEIAEKGYAAHWKYKSQKEEHLHPKLSEFMNKLRDTLATKARRYRLYRVPQRFSI